MATHVGDIFINAKLDTSEYKKGLSLLDKDTSNFVAGISKKITKIGLATVAAKGLLSFVKSATQAGASLNAMGTIIDASLPHMTAQVDAFAKSAGAAFGLSETQAKGFVGKFASMAHAMGYTERQAYAMSTSLAGLAGDVASYYHITQDEAFTKLNAVFTGETESLKSLGIVMTQNALDAFAMEQGLGKTVNQMTELEKTSLRYQFILNSLSLAQGDYAKYSDTWSGSLATIKLNWQNFMATVGQGLINILLPLLQFIAKLSKVLTWLGEKFLWLTRLITGKDAEVGASLDQTFGADTQDMFSDAGTSIGNVGTGLGNTGKNAKKTKKDIQSLKRELMGFDQITKLMKADENTGTTGASGAGGGGIGGSLPTDELGDFTDLMDQLKVPDTTTESWDGWGKVVADALQLILSLGRTAINDIISPLLGLVTKEIIPTAFDILGTALKNIVDTVTQFPKWLMDLLTNGDKNVKITVDDEFTDTWNEIKKAGNISITAYVGLERGFVGTVADWLANNKYIGSVTVPVGLTQSFTGGKTTVWDWLKQTTIWGTAKSIELFLALSRFSTVWGWLSSSEVWGSAVNATIKLAQDFGKGVSTVWGWLKQGSIWGTGTNAIVGLELNSKITTVADWLKSKSISGGGVKKKIGLKKAGFSTVKTWLETKKRFGKGVFKSIGLQKPDDKKYAWGTVKSWVETSSRWGKGVFKSIGLISNGWKTVSDWVLGKMGKAVSATVSVTPQASGGVFKNGRWSPITEYASGGFPTGGQMFIARERGAELVGTLKGHTAVMNNDQIVASVSAGVARAISSIKFVATAPPLATYSRQPAQSQQVIQDNREMIELLRSLLIAVNSLDLDVQLDGESIKKNTVRRINQHTRATGRLELIV